MVNNIKGLTIEIDGDTTKLGKALDEVDKKSKDLSKELGEVNKLLKMDPGNAELLAQKQKILADAVENTSKRLETLKDAERQVQEQFQRGEVSEEQVRALQREVIACTKKLEGYENAAKETADAVENLGKKSKEALEETAQVNDKLAGGLAKGLGGVATIAAGAVTALAATAEETREYRAEMGKLDAAYEASGHTAQTATDIYRTLQGVIGETDQSVEAAQQIALLAESEKDAAEWADLAAGVVGRFGDALQPETFFEAANETLKLGESTGAFTQMLEGCGINVEGFNEKLAACSTEQEKQAYLLSVARDALGAAGESYKQNSADVIAANQATEQWAAGMAEIGAFMEPVITEVKSFGAELLTYVVPALQAILDNLPAIGVAVAGVTAAMVAFKVASLAATAASQGMTLAQYAMAAAQKVLNAVMSANPIGLIILAITALVTAFMLLWNNCEGFREFWINLWEKIKSATQKAIDAVVDFFKSLPDRAQAMLDWFKNLPYKLGEFLGKAVGKAATWAVNMAKKAKETGKNFVQAVVDFFKQLPTKAATFLTNVVNKVASWRTSLVNKGKSAAKGLADAVVNGIKTLPSKITEIGKNLVKGLWNGITGMASWIKNKVTSFASGILDGFKSTFKVNSPSRETEWLGEMLDAGLAEGIEGNAKQPIKAMQNVSGGVLDATATEVGGIGFERGLSRRGSVAGAVASVADNSALLSKLDGIYERLGRLQVVLDSGTLVGETIDKIDAALGNRQLLSARGV